MRWAWVRSAFERLASLRLAALRLACERLASLRLAAPRLACFRSTRMRLALHNEGRCAGGSRRISSIGGRFPAYGQSGFSSAALVSHAGSRTTKGRFAMATQATFMGQPLDLG